MLPTGIFNVLGFSCYIGEPKQHKVNVVLEGCFPLLQAEYAVSAVAKALGGASATIEWVKGTSRYCCRVNDVPVEVLEKWPD